MRSAYYIFAMFWCNFLDLFSALMEAQLRQNFRVMKSDNLPGFRMGNTLASSKHGSRIALLGVLRGRFCLIYRKPDYAFVSPGCEVLRVSMMRHLVDFLMLRRRQLMNFVLVTTAGIPVLVALGCYLWYFVPPVSGGGGGAQLAGDVDGNPVTLESWVKSHKDNDRELVQGLKGEPYYLISTPDNIKDFALLSVCTHLGCVVPWNKAANKFCCPCHGSQYDENGKVVRGPAPLSLALAHTTTLEGKLALSPWPEQDFRTGLDPWWK